MFPRFFLVVNKSKEEKSSVRVDEGESIVWPKLGFNIGNFAFFAYFLLSWQTKKKQKHQISVTLRKTSLGIRFWRRKNFYTQTAKEKTRKTMNNWKRSGTKPRLNAT